MVDVNSPSCSDKDVFDFIDFRYFDGNSRIVEILCLWY